MARDKGPVRTWAEYVALRAFLGAAHALPPSLTFWLSDRIGDLAYRIDREHRETATGNLAAVFGGAPGDERHQRTARAVFRNFARVGVEFALLPRLIESRGLDELVRVTGREHVEAALAPGKGVIVWSAHVGNWEVVAALGAPLGMRLHTVGRKMDNPRIDRYLTEQRARYALSVIPKDGGLPQIVRALKGGACVAMLLDQHAGRSGIEVDFLGRPASTFRAAAELAVRFGLPMLGGYGIRTDRAPHFHLEFEPPLWPNEGAAREDEVRRLTQAVSDSIGGVVRRHPEQWNWLHRRWRQKKRKHKSTSKEPNAKNEAAPSPLESPT